MPIAVFQTAQKQFSNRQLVELVGVLGYYWMLGRVATVFQVDLDVATGTGVYDEGLRLVGQKSGQAHWSAHQALTPRRTRSTIIYPDAAVMPRPASAAGASGSLSPETAVKATVMLCPVLTYLPFDPRRHGKAARPAGAPAA